MKSVLIVDDNLASLQQIHSQLKNDYKVSLAKSGEMAVRICSSAPPDLLLLDVEMSEMDGFQTLARLKENPSLRHVPVIFLTSSHDPATEVRCLEAGAVDFISKPVHTDILRHRVGLHLQLSEHQLHLKKVIKELEDNISISFAELLECKDFNVAGHLLRTGIYVELLAVELIERGLFADELTVERAKIMRRATPFHDIGKIGISDIILQKEGPLTDEERMEMRKHPLVGGRMLRIIYERTPNQHYLETAIEIAEGHHECFDGTGYPRGLRGDDIPLSCRIMALANVYDSFITDRIYRKAFSHGEAVEMVIAGRGTKFDPRVVDAFGSLEELFLEIGTSPFFQVENLVWDIYK